MLCELVAWCSSCELCVRVVCCEDFEVLCEAEGARVCSGVARSVKRLWSLF